MTSIETKSNNNMH